jgi:glycosyltransferase involved in cell wall biosynthesis
MSAPSRAPLRYLLVNHVAFGSAPTPGRLVVGDLWLSDLRAQVSALSRVARVTVAAPLLPVLDASASASFNVVEIDPRAEGFELVGLPHFLSLRGYLEKRGELRRRLAEAVAGADVVQADSGGFPFALGSIVWPIAGRAGCRRIWVFDGADPFPRLELAVRQERRPLKKLGKSMATAAFRRFCRRALTEADLVFAHNSSVVERFRPWWNERCHAFDRTFVTDQNLLTPAQLTAAEARLRDRSAPLRLVVAGRQIAIKGTDQVLKAAAMARARGVRVEVDVIGDGEDLESFRALARSTGAEPHTRFLGRVAYGDELFAAWGRAQVLVITNLTAETSRNVLLGAARGLPLIMYRNPGADALVEPRRAAWLVPTGDVPALADAFARADREREELVGLARRGHALASEKTLDACHRRRTELVGTLA